VIEEHNLGDHRDHLLLDLLLEVRPARHQISFFIY